MRPLKFFLLMLVTALTLSAAPVNSQSLATTVGLPDEFSPLENCVLTGKTSTAFSLEAILTFKRVGIKRVVDTAWTYSTVTKSDNSITGYALNMVYNYLYEFGYEYAGDMNLNKPDKYATIPIGPFAGKTYYYGYYSATIEPVPGGYDMTVKGYPFKNANKDGNPALVPWETYSVIWVNRLTTSGKTVNGNYTATKPWLESKLGVTEAWLAENTGVTYHFRTANPSTHVCSIFGLVQKTGDTYTNATLINGKYYKNLAYQTLKTQWGNPLGELNFSWVVYNDCAIPAVKPTDANSTGNFGECFRKMYNSTDPKSLSVTIIPGTAYAVNNSTGTITYDSNKPAAVQLVVHRNPMPEKNTEQEGYWSLTKNSRVYSLQGL